MQIIEKIKQIQEAAKRQGIVITDILENGDIVSDLPAYCRIYQLVEAEGEDEKEKKLELKDEKTKTDKDSKESAATSIVDNLINGDFEGALKDLRDYTKLDATEKVDSKDEKEDKSEEDAKEDGEASGTDKDYMMPASDEKDEKNESLDEMSDYTNYEEYESSMKKDGKKYMSKEEYLEMNK